MDYEMIAIDLDGTLKLTHGSVSSGNIEAIHRAIDNGIAVVICSGRSQASLAKFIKEIGLNEKGSYGISFNGAVIFKADTLEEIFEHRLDIDNTRKTIELIKKSNPETPIMVYTEPNIVYYDIENEEVHEYVEFSGIESKKVNDLSTDIDKDILKIIIRWEPEKLNKLYADIEDEVKKYSHMFYSYDNLLEFSPIGSDKGVGMRKLAEILDIDMKKVVGIGDNYNDLALVKEAGFGVAVENAVDEVKAVADYITKNNNDNDAVKELIDLILPLE